ncbi:hypothetical protein K469DRAFT_291564 [Zopfia rhizophila CBS 207.26]|uniref:Mif2/CENP-C cupin domain-containing protein n=1 Tax=Zopfia rhizophila CBS 207.26 TaxID=1314779 RepID=A0A6A6DRJ7_9PEZI|nr:hypothetical protein K469DRAFT_291564 [Zopfia rhizophila CBS 207.26]
MAPAKKRENQFFDVGVQGRKTGITLQDRGVRDEHGMEPISGIFSSPEKSPLKRNNGRRTGGTVTTSESMDIQESSIPDIAETINAGHLLRSSRTKLPPPLSRSPMKTTLGSSPRRQSSMGPRRQSLRNASSPGSSSSHPAVSRRLDFEEESSIQDTGSVSRRGKRASVYDIEPSPVRGNGSVIEESLQEEITPNEESEIVNGVPEDSYFAEVEQSETVPEPEEQPVKRGRKRKSDAISSTVEEEASTSKPRRKGARAEQKATVKKGKKAVETTVMKPRGRQNRLKGFSETATEEEPSTALDNSTTEEHSAPVPTKSRGRPAGKAKVQTEKNASSKEKGEPAFKKPKAVAKPKANTKAKSDPEPCEQSAEAQDPAPGKLISATGQPLSKTDIEQMSTVSAGSRYGRGRQLHSVYRELGPEQDTRVVQTRAGRHHLPPIDFWRNERMVYDVNGTLQSIVKNDTKESPKKEHKQRKSGRKRALLAVDDEEELEEWEENSGKFDGTYRGFDPATEVFTDEVFEDTLAWAQKGMNICQVAGAQFSFAKISSAPGNFLNWGIIELPEDGLKRPKNSRRMHMVFFVASGAVEVNVNNNEFTIHKGGVWQVPRGELPTILISIIALLFSSDLLSSIPSFTLQGIQDTIALVLQKSHFYSVLSLPLVRR